MERERDRLLTDMEAICKIERYRICVSALSSPGKVAAAKAQALGIGKGNPKLQFAQLKGMAEGLSFGLRNAGFQVSKYLPYGPVEMVMPYLLRSAEENRGLLSASTMDRQLMRKELMRRVKTAMWGGDFDKMIEFLLVVHGMEFLQDVSSLEMLR